eukprot:7065372-Pyramimonas_sp.AAC.1
MTFSAAIWRDGVPLVLRTWHAPWGITGIKPSLRNHVAISNELFQAHIELLATIAVSRGVGWHEHPAPPS